MLKTDFKTWERASLELFARAVNDQNLQVIAENEGLRAEVAALKQDNKAALTAWRCEIAKCEGLKNDTTPNHIPSPLPTAESSRPSPFIPEPVLRSGV